MDLQTMTYLVVGASFALYNTPDEVDRLVAGVAKALEFFR